MKYNELTGGGTQQRVFWLDLLKVVSIIAMIALHVSAYQLSEQSTGGLNWQISNFINSCSRFCVPVFVMISGSIFLNRDCSMSKYIGRISVALLFWTLAYTLYASSIDLVHGNLTLIKFVKGLFHPTYLWFLFMVLGLYLSTPILRMIIKKDTVICRFLTLWVIFGVVLPMMSNVPLISSYVNSVLFQTHFTIAIEYCGYFVLGYYLTTHKRLISTRLAWLLVFIGIISTFVGTWLVAEKLGRLSEMFYNYLSPMTLLSSFGIFTICKNLLENYQFKPRLQTHISSLATISLGIYAIHMFFLVAINKIGLQSLIGCAIISVPLICSITFIVSSLIALLMARLPILHRLV